MYRIGIDLGGTNIAAGLVDEKMNIVDRLTVPTNVPRPMAAIIDDMVALTRRLMERGGLTEADILSVGVGVPCTANGENGHMEDANNLGFDDEPFLPLLQEKLAVPVYFGNDANVAAWGEYLYGGYEEDSFIMVTIGTGIGGGIILNGKLWAGVNGAAGEFGHIGLTMEGVRCTCGRVGCFEAYASASALVAQARRVMMYDDTVLWELCGGELSQLEAKLVFDGAAAGDEVCIRLLDRYTGYLAEGITSIINAFQPANLCIGGGVSRAGDALLLPLKEKVWKGLYSKNSKRNTNITLAKLDNDAGIIGAALLGS